MSASQRTGLCTNVLLRWLLDGSMIGDDAPKQQEAAARLLEDRSRVYFVNHIVLAETSWIVRKKLKQDKKVVVEMVDRLLSAANVLLENEDVVRGAMDAYRTGVADLADELISHINHAAGCETTLTFDKDAALSPHFSLLA